MARTLGRDGVVKVGSNAVAEVTGWTLDQTAGTIDGTVLGDTWAQNDADVNSWSGTVECKWDDTDATGQEAMTVGATVTLGLYPEGDGVGAYEYAGDAIITSISGAGATGGHVTRSIGFTGAGALTIGTA